MQILKDSWTYKNIKILLFTILIFPSLFTSAQQWYPGRLLIKPKPNTTLTQLSAFQKTLNIKKQKLIQAGNNNWMLVEFDPLQNVQEKALEYIKSGLIQYAHPDYLITPAITPNDPYLLDLDETYNIQLINAPSAWNYYHNASNIIVAIVDTGIRYTHQDLNANMWINPREIPGNGIDDDNNGYIDDIYGINLSEADQPTGDPMDTTGHGTHVAGIAGAVGNNGLGITGIAWNIQLMACSFMSSTGGEISSAIECINYARKHGAKIINASWTIQYDTPIFRDELNLLRQNGIMLICAAGNNGINLDSNPQYPACYSKEFQNVITVGNSDQNDSKAYDSNYSSQYVNLFAPGRYITSASSKNDTQYRFSSGTSMSTPHVAGAVALYMSNHPQDNYEIIKSKLLSSVDPIPNLTSYCTSGGRLNLAQFLTGEKTPQLNWSSPTPITYGIPLSSEQLNASANINGTFTYNPTYGTILPAGTHILTTSFTSFDNGYHTTEKSVSLTVNKATPQITLIPPSPIEYGTPLRTNELALTSNTPGNFTFSPAIGTILPIGTNIITYCFIPSDQQNYNQIENSTYELIVLPVKHPADLDKNYTLTSEECNLYYSSWLAGEPWKNNPSEIPIEYVTRTGYLLNFGGTYTQDTSIPNPPLYWIPVSGGIDSNLLTARRSAANNQITITLTPSDSKQCTAIEENIPQGAFPQNISDGGVFNSIQGKIKWGPWGLESLPNTVSYKINTLPGTEESFVLSGIVSSDGKSHSIEGTSAINIRTEAPQLSISLEDNQIILFWDTDLFIPDGYQLVLQQASSTDGDWQTLLGAHSGYTLSLTKKTFFYRLCIEQNE